MKLPALLLPAVVAVVGSCALVAAHAQSPQQILDNLMQQAQPAPGGGAPVEDTGMPQTKFFETAPPAEELLNALLPAPETKDLMVIPRNQQRAAALLITFDHDSDRIGPAAREFLDRLAVVLRDPRMTPYRVAMEGHTDITGDADYNLDLSRRRANAAAAYLYANYGINPGALTVTGVGEYQLVYPADPYHRNNRSVLIAAVGRR